uniref:Uncharacterized protein n=1 Tax=Acrobeloides nanus TaxID=290746 RepID=A0A914D4D9_9BILA
MGLIKTHWTHKNPWDSYCRLEPNKLLNLNYKVTASMAESDILKCPLQQPVSMVANDVPKRPLQQVSTSTRPLSRLASMAAKDVLKRPLQPTSIVSQRPHQRASTTTKSEKRQLDPTSTDICDVHEQQGPTSLFELASVANNNIPKRQRDSSQLLLASSAVNSTTHSTMLQRLNAKSPRDDSNHVSPRNTGLKIDIKVAERLILNSLGISIARRHAEPPKDNLNKP